ncbi:unnamed protein product [Notodromas monacha]|uniref:Coiled-coil domain-containing protein 169 n=1 Tax=Notodromas monacha TaxID=399045 RepID=A0A7R9BPB3_9CRUS|nr:unnamed protein product [Notodromas monacha]CAG0918903.1 unnamed protein product [Notodromas monacha]
MDYTALQDEEEQRVLREIEEERKLRSSLQWTIEDLERAMVPLEDQIRRAAEERSEGNEWTVRYKAQKELNELLEKQFEWLRDEYTRKQELLSEGTLDARNLDLARFTEYDLARLKSELERERNHMRGLLRDSEWKLDQRSKEVFHLNDRKKAYQAQSLQLDWQLEKIRGAVSEIPIVRTPDATLSRRSHRVSRSQSPSSSRRSPPPIENTE